MNFSSAQFRNCPAHGKHTGKVCPRCGTKTEMPFHTCHATKETSEAKLHAEIKAWCKAQWPQWVVLSARMDVPSTLPVGAHDLTIFAPFKFFRNGDVETSPRVFAVELKTKTGKLSKEQAAWRELMRCAGHTVHIIRSMPEFLEIVK